MNSEAQLINSQPTIWSEAHRPRYSPSFRKVSYCISGFVNKKGRDKKIEIWEQNCDSAAKFVVISRLMEGTMSLRGISVFLILLTCCLSGFSHAQTTISLGGYCDSVSNPALAFVLDGLGQTTNTNCVYGPGSPNVSVFLGQTVPQSGTLTNLVVKQQQLNSAPMGGTATVWVNQKTGGAVVQTSISCSLAFLSTTLYKCNSAATFSVVAGDRIIVIVTPPNGQSMSPVEATVDINTVSTAYQTFVGYCGSVSNTGLAFVLNGLGQTTNTNCVYGPGSPTVSVFLGQAIPRTGTIKNLYVKQQQLNFAPFGGTVSVWINQKNGGSPVQTSISCSLAQQGSLALCNDTLHTFSVTTGDKIIVIVTPPPNVSISPVTATIDVQ